MKQQGSILLLTLNPFVLWIDLAFKTGEMLIASAQVIHHRTGRIAAAGVIPSVRDQREFTLMGREKVEAMAESAQLVAVRLVGLNQQIMTLTFKQMMTGATGVLTLAASRDPMQSSRRQAKLVRETVSNSTSAASQLADTVVILADQGLKPIHSRATANARRLARLKK